VSNVDYVVLSARIVLFDQSATIKKIFETHLKIFSQSDLSEINLRNSLYKYMQKTAPAVAHVLPFAQSIKT
jgi:hypothetical protein